MKLGSRVVIYAYKNIETHKKDNLLKFFCKSRYFDKKGRGKARFCKDLGIFLRTKLGKNFASTKR